MLRVCCAASQCCRAVIVHPDIPGKRLLRGCHAGCQAAPMGRRQRGLQCWHRGTSKRVPVPPGVSAHQLLSSSEASCSQGESETLWRWSLPREVWRWLRVKVGGRAGGSAAQPAALPVPGLERYSPAKCAGRSNPAFWERAETALLRFPRLHSTPYRMDINGYE